MILKVLKASIAEPPAALRPVVDSDDIVQMQQLARQTPIAEHVAA